MKKTISIAAIIVIIASSHYALWNYISKKAEDNFDKIMQNSMEYQTGELKYDLRKSGYPFNIKFELMHIGIYNETSEFSITSNTGKGLSVSTPFSFNPNTFTIDLSGIGYTANILSLKENIAINISVDKGSTKIYTKDNLYNLKSFAKNILLNIQIPNEKINSTVNIANVIFNKNTETLQNEITSKMDMNVSDTSIKYNTPNNNIAFNIDSYIFKGGVKNLPLSIADVSQEIMNIASSTEPTLNLVNIKKYLVDFSHKMAQSLSVIYLDEFSYKLSGLPNVDDFSFVLSTNLSVADNYTPRGDINLKLEGLNKIAEAVMKNQKSSDKMMQIPPMALAFMKSGKIELNLKTDNDGMLMFNGLPILKLPTLDNIISQIPNNVNNPSK